MTRSVPPTAAPFILLLNLFGVVRSPGRLQDISALYTPWTSRLLS
ncbi:hypothetical protein QUA00_11590 [Microcoleus sp. T2B6]